MPLSFVIKPSPPATAVVPGVVPPSIKLISVAVAVTPSKIFNSAGVAVICVELSAANTGIVPDTFGNLIVLSAVGSIVVKVVSWSSAEAPSNTKAF